MGRPLFFIFIIFFLIIFASATNVSVSVSTYQAEASSVNVLYFENGPLSSTTHPAVNTQTVQPSVKGSTTITRGSTDYLWSPQFTKGLSLPSGVLVVDFWASGKKSGTFVISATVTNSKGSPIVILGTSSVTLSTSETEYVINFPINSTNIPPSGYISIAFSLPTGHSEPSSINVYWGASQPTNFQIEEYVGGVVTK